MHSVIGPWNEAQAVYVAQSRLAERLVAPDPSPLVLFDIGLGIAANSLAVLERFRAVSGAEAMAGGISGVKASVRDLHLISFETDLSGIAEAMKHPQHFPFLSRSEGVIQTLLRERRYSEQNSEATCLWELKEGDFRKFLLELPSPELIYYDLYSPRTCPDLWTHETFALLFRSTHERRALGLSSLLVTYCAASSVRAAMKTAGFAVTIGAPTMKKRETTLAWAGECHRPLSS